MDMRTDILPDNVDELKAIILSLQKTNSEIQKNYNSLECDIKSLRTQFDSVQSESESWRRKYLVAIAKYFTPTKEKIEKEMRGQLSLFNEVEACADEKEKRRIEKEMNRTITIERHERRKGGKRKLPQMLPIEEHVHELDSKDRICACCGKQRPIIGEDRTEELDIIPMKLNRTVHVTKKYGPCQCDEFLESGQREILLAEKPRRFIPYSFVSAGLAAYIIDMKYNYGLPMYRLSKYFEAIEMVVSRATLCNWAILAAEKCDLLYSEMLAFIKRSEIIQMDETSVQVLKEDGRAAETKSFMWVMRGGDEKRKITLFHYSPTRNGEVPLKLLENFKGFLQTDGYEGYTKAVSAYKLTHVGCLAHIRRKFYDLVKGDRKSETGKKALWYIGKIYEKERKLRAENMSDDEFVKKRKEKVVPILDDFKAWLDEESVALLPGVDAGKAVNYALGQWDKFVNYLGHARLTPDNNAVENAIRPFVIGRKNWLFSNTPRGARSSAVLYSLVESAKNNGLVVYNYLRYLFTNLPYAETPEDLQKLLPCNLSTDQVKITG